jgi:hypothetical protein
MFVIRLLFALLSYPLHVSFGLFPLFLILQSVCALSSLIFMRFLLFMHTSIRNFCSIDHFYHSRHLCTCHTLAPTWSLSLAAIQGEEET